MVGPLEVPEKFMVGGTGGSMVGWHMAQEEVWWRVDNRVRKVQVLDFLSFEL